MINTLLGKKLQMGSRFDEKGAKVSVTLLEVGPCSVTQIKNDKTDGYFSVQISFGSKKTKQTSKPILGHIKKAGLSRPPRFLKEVRLPQEADCKTGDVLKVADVFSLGDKISVTGISKGKGFAGVMKRWGFAGGPATHGQSDRKRAPGSIGGQGVARVLPGKKMPGRMGTNKTTVSGLTVMDINSEENLLVVKGAVPGSRGGLLMIRKAGKAKNFTPLLRKKQQNSVLTD